MPKPKKPAKPKRRLFIQATTKDGARIFRIKSSDGKDHYETKYNPEKATFNCTCPGAGFRPGVPCRHVCLAVVRVARELGMPHLNSEAERNRMKKISETAINVGPVRLSYLNVFKPRMNVLKGEAQYSATLLIPKKPHDHLANPKVELEGIAAAINAAALDKFGESVKKFDRPLKDGDVETDNQNQPRYPGFWFMNATTSTEYPPKLLDGNVKPITGGFESGDWGIVQVNFGAYDFQGKKGVGCYLRAIQFLYVDEHFGGAGGASESDFDQVEDASRPAPTGAASPDEYDPFVD